MSDLESAPHARLIKFLGLLGSEHDGEIANAGAWRIGSSKPMASAGMRSLYQLAITYGIGVKRRGKFSHRSESLSGSVAFAGASLAAGAVRS
jgi:hypothetical protein